MMMNRIEKQRMEEVEPEQSFEDNFCFLFEMCDHCAEKCDSV